MYMYFISLHFIYIISSCCGSNPWTLLHPLGTLCHSCGFDYQQRVLKPFLRPDYLLSEHGPVWLWHLLVNM